MKARKTLTLLLLAALTLAACKYDDSELWEQVNQNTEELAAQAARIAALEAWQAETNTNIQALQTLLSTTDYITAVTPVVKDGVEVGFTISFLNTPAITIYHGAKGDKGDTGDTPQIGAAQDDDGNWYWTLNGEFLTDTDGNPIRANGTQGEQGDQGPAGDDAPLPQLATGKKLNEQQITTDSQNKDIEPDAIYLSVDGGKTWTRVSGEDGEKGDKGDTPQIGAAQADDGNWYWTLNGELLTDTDGNPIRANGTQGEQGDQGPAGDDAPLPQLATGKKLNEQQITTDSQNKDIEPDAIYLSVDGGKTWTRVSGEDGEKGDTGDTGPKGDSFFESVDTTNADYVIFKLANNGGTFQVPRYTGISLTFDPESLSLHYDEKATIQCTAEGSAEFTTDNLFVVAPAGWKADIALTRAASTGFTLTVTAPADITSGVATGEILVMLDNKKGSTTIGRIPVACTQITLGNVSEGQLAKLIGSRTDLTSITVTSGTLNDADWNAIKQNEWALRTLDLEGATYNTSDLKYVKMLYIDPVPLTTAKLPQGVTVLGIDAFVNCNNLTSIELPASLTKIGLAAFYSCSKLASITCRAAVPPEMSTSVLLDVTSLFEIQVPAKSVDAYQAASEWSNYADKIVAIPEP